MSPHKRTQPSCGGQIYKRHLMHGLATILCVFVPITLLKPGMPICSEVPIKLAPYVEDIQEAAEFHDLPFELVTAVIWRESGGDPDIVSRYGAIGLMGIDPHFHSCATYHPAGNIYCGTSILAEFVRNANGDVRSGLAAYNAGETGRDEKNLGWDFANLIQEMTELFVLNDGFYWCVHNQIPFFHMRNYQLQ